MSIMQPNGTADRSQHDADAESAQAQMTRATEWSSEQLFGNEQEVVIRHDGHLYRLRRTKLGKLILTK